jgi:hypothetical protein
MKLKEFTILQITPSNGFSAVFANDDATVYLRPLACWALIRRTIELTESDWDKLEELNLPMTDVVSPKQGEPLAITRVEGMSSDEMREIDPCENNEYFLGYAGPNENPLDFQDRARELIDSFMEDEDDETEENNEEYERLPQALSHLSVQVQERIRKGNVPPRWEQGGWLEFMRHFGDLSGG